MRTPSPRPHLGNKSDTSPVHSPSPRQQVRPRYSLVRPRTGNKSDIAMHFFGCFPKSSSVRPTCSQSQKPEGPTCRQAPPPAQANPRARRACPEWRSEGAESGRKQTRRHPTDSPRRPSRRPRNQRGRTRGVPQHLCRTTPRPQTGRTGGMKGPGAVRLSCPPPRTGGARSTSCSGLRRPINGFSREASRASPRSR